MTTIPSITEDEFDGLLRSFKRTAFRLETRDSYALGYEAPEFAEFLRGAAQPPPEVSWWRPWLEQIRHLTREGKTVSRVRILAEPPSDYQRWELWAARWHSAAGEHISYMPRSRAREVRLPTLHDWWLLDDERVILMWFTETGGISHKTLSDDPRIVGRHREWRDLAVRNATPAEEIAAA